MGRSGKDETVSRSILSPGQEPLKDCFEVRVSSRMVLFKEKSAVGPWVRWELAQEADFSAPALVTLGLDHSVVGAILGTAGHGAALWL